MLRHTQIIGELCCIKAAKSWVSSIDTILGHGYNRSPKLLFVKFVWPIGLTVRVDSFMKVDD